MKKLGLKLAGMALFAMLCMLTPGREALAAPDDTIPQGVSAAGTDLSGMTREEAAAAAAASFALSFSSSIRMLTQPRIVFFPAHS